MTLLRNGLNALLLLGFFFLCVCVCMFFFCVCACVFFGSFENLLDFPWLSKPKVFFFNTRVNHNKALYALHFAGARSRNSSFQISAF